MVNKRKSLIIKIATLALAMAPATRIWPSHVWWGEPELPKHFTQQKTDS